MSDAFAVVEKFEKRVAAFAGAKYGVAVASGTWAVFLACKCAGVHKINVTLPARTFISVPMAVLQAGGAVRFEDYEWSGLYELFPFRIFDGALRWRSQMYAGGLHCLSFHARKHLPIGEGGMILTDDAYDAEWLRQARYSGRRGPDYRVEDVSAMGWQAYMNPEKAARGLHLMDYNEVDKPDQVVVYPDLRQCPVFK
jgi:dTDP-4-amino-4,6-dideoxygalactose transaminase